jgi:hypothetical protein
MYLSGAAMRRRHLACAITVGLFAFAALAATPPIDQPATTAAFQWLSDPGGSEGTRTCPEATIEILIQTDDYGDETTWEVVDLSNGTVIANGGPYDNNTLYTEEVCVPYGGCYEFIIYDDYGDGICCDYGPGFYQVYFEGELVGEGGVFEFSDVVTQIGDGCGTDPFGACCLPDGACIEVLASECLFLDGVFLGPDTSCDGGAPPLFPDMGLTLDRLDLQFGDAYQENSFYGMATVNYDALISSTGITGGFVNVATPQGWVVRNLPVDPDAGYSGLSVMFDLGPYDGIDAIPTYATYTPEPLVCFGPFPEVDFSVGHRLYNAQGSHEIRSTLPTTSVDLSVVTFGFGGLIEGVWQPGHPSVEQDTNQCGPAAVANSLQWMEDEYGIKIPHDHEPGIRDDTLPGELDQDMNRPAHQPVASAVNFVDGKLRYVDDNDLADEVHVKHKSRQGINWIPNSRTIGDATSHVNNDPDTSFLDWLLAELEAGEDVELRIGWTGGGGHYICLTGGGRILGVPYLTWVHDADQGHDGNDVDENGGVSADDGGHGFSWVDGNQIRCFIEGETGTATIDYAVSESPIYPENRASQYTATMYGDGSGGGGTFTEDGIFDTLYDDPTWANDTTLNVDNVAVDTYYKTVYVNVLFAEEQDETPEITCADANGDPPRQTTTVWRDGNTNLLYCFELEDQPAAESITFPNANYRNMDGILRLGVACYCQHKPDCNGNGIDDREEVLDPTNDVNGNGVPDECDFGDCNGNGAADIDDIDTGESPDCNENGLPDECDIDLPGIADCNNNGIPDSCDTDAGGDAEDCNGNRIPDACDIDSGYSQDLNGNGIPDECEAGTLLGDMNCDGVVSPADIDPFVIALVQGQAAYEALFPDCNYLNGDVNNDGQVTPADIDPFVQILTGG